MEPKTDPRACCRSDCLTGIIPSQGAGCVDFYESHTNTTQSSWFKMEKIEDDIAKLVSALIKIY